MELFRRIAAWLGSRRRADDLTAEIEAHRAFAQEELERAGLASPEAAAESRRRMGNVTLAVEDARDAWIVRWLDRLRQNFRYGLRGLLREPAFALTAIATLALGTAAMTTVFSIADAELWRVLPFKNADRLVVVRSRDTSPRKNGDGISVDELRKWRSDMPALADIAAESEAKYRVVRLDSTQSLYVAGVTANFFTTLGRTPIAGRVFNNDDARGSTAVVIGSRAWKRAFEARPDLIGATIFIDNEPHVVVGVVETNDSRGSEDDIFVPIDETAGGPRGDETTFYSLIARLAPGATDGLALTQAQTFVDRLGALDRTRVGHAAEVRSISDFYRVSDGRSLYFFLAAAFLVLLLTIVNVAGLTLSRSARRTPEFALRGALGGGTGAIVGQLAVEAALLAAPGCLLGLWLASDLVGVVAHMTPSGFLHRGRDIVVDARAVAMCASVVALTMAGLALAPLGVTRRARGTLVMAAGMRSTAQRSAGTTRERMLMAQMALTVVLIAVGTLLLKSFVAQANTPLGFDPNDGWSMRVALNDPKYRDDALRRQFVESLVEGARAIPGVRAAAAATSSPLVSGFSAQIAIPGSTDEAANARSIYRAVTPDYFTTVSTRLTRGRPFNAADVAGAPDVAIVNERVAQQLFPGRDPIGQRIEIRQARTTQVRAGTVTIVGVAANIKDVLLNEAGVGDIYLPLAQRPATGLELIVRGNGASESMPAALKAVAAAADPGVAINGIAALDRRVTAALQEARFNLTLATGFAMIAVLIGGIGIYGAMSYAAVARAREFGVRLALGASPRRLLHAALWQAARFGVVGSAIGVIAAVGVAVWIGDALYTVQGLHNGLLVDVKTTDPVALGAAAAGVILVALLSGAIPARRLSKIDPVKTLRTE